MEKQKSRKKFVRKAKIGDTILFKYTAKLNDGSVVGSNENKKPMKLTLGKDQIHCSLEIKIVGMAEGESKFVAIPADKAYGHYRRDLVFVIDKKRFKSKEPEVGEYYTIQFGDSDKIKTRVTRMNDSEVILDGNHVLAGKDINYEIELIKITN